MTMAERVLRTQKENLKAVDNYRFKANGIEYRIRYEGGLSETINVYGRKDSAKPYRYVDGFAGYKMHDKEQVIAYAKGLIAQRQE